MTYDFFPEVVWASCARVRGTVTEQPAGFGASEATWRIWQFYRFKLQTVGLVLSGLEPNCSYLLL